MYRPTRDISFTQEHILISFKNRDTELFCMNDQKKELLLVRKEKTNEHSGKIICMDSNIQKNLFITGGEDGYVKIWTNEKDLIREICFPEQIDAVCFLNEKCDILIGHAAKVSIILAEDYKPFHIIKEPNISIADEESKEQELDKPALTVVTDELFEKLKAKEDQLIAETTTKDYYTGTKKKKKTKGQIPNTIDNFKTEGSPIKLSKRQSKMQRDESDDSKSEGSEEELVTEEMFQKALEATIQRGKVLILIHCIEMEKKKRKKAKTKPKGKSKIKLTKRASGKGKSKRRDKTMRVGDSFRKEDRFVVSDSYMQSNVSMNYEDCKKYKPLCTALPGNLKAPPTIAERIRAAKRLHMTRRDMTEQKIIKNIMLHNDPADVQNFEVLYISTKNEKLLPEQLEEDSKQVFPPL